MKICAIIAEYNPFHLGHLKHIDYVKNVLGAKKVVVIMSGNFTQRGEIAVLDKFTRARHAVLAGADAVIELPTPFAIGNAQTFATGAINLVCDLNIFDSICFGVESGNKQSYIDLATAMNNESKEFKRALKVHLDNGVSLGKAKFLAVKEMGNDSFDESLISSPNNILALEYTKALLRRKSEIEIFPMKREESHSDYTLRDSITSATSIRQALKVGKIKKLKKNVPDYVYQDLAQYPFGIDKMIMTALITTSKEKLATRPDCTEGLENRIKALSKDNLTVEELLAKVITKRYTETRVRRILTANMLGLDRDTLADVIEGKTYGKVLAVSKNSKDLISELCDKSSVAILTRKSDVENLKKESLKAYEFDVLASDLYNLATDSKSNENQMLII